MPVAAVATRSHRTPALVAWLPYAKSPCLSEQVLWTLEREAEVGLHSVDRVLDFAASEPAFQLEALRLDELRIATMELSLETEMALGRHELVVGELESAVEEHPYRERLWYLLIEALAGADRRIEAIRACDRLRTLLADVGLDATDELRRVEDRIFGVEPAGADNGASF